MVFPREIFKALWIWQVYGGWRGLYQLAIEPWVGYPVRLEEAIEAGRQFILRPDEPVEYEVAVIAYEEFSSVHSIQQVNNTYKVISDHP